jgi:hypothetical protein
MFVKDSCVKFKGKLKNTFQDEMAGKTDCRFHPNQGERKVKIKFVTSRKVLGKVHSVPVLVICKEKFSEMCAKAMTDIVTKILGVGERDILTRMNGRARNLESKNRSGNENYVKSYNTMIEKCVNVILFDKDKWSAAIACVNKYKPSIQNTVMSHVCDKDIQAVLTVYKYVSWTFPNSDNI